MDERFSILQANSFEVRGPWLARKALELDVTFIDTSYLGSKVHFLRFDLYPLFAPAHFNRHHGFWDIPLENLRDEHAAVVLTESQLLVQTNRGNMSFAAGWKGALAFKGYCMLHVSLWDTSSSLPAQSVSHCPLSGRNRSLVAISWRPHTSGFQVKWFPAAVCSMVRHRSRSKALAMLRGFPSWRYGTVRITEHFAGKLSKVICLMNA